MNLKFKILVLGGLMTLGAFLILTLSSAGCGCSCADKCDMSNRDCYSATGCEDCNTHPGGYPTSYEGSFGDCYIGTKYKGSACCSIDFFIFQFIA